MLGTVNNGDHGGGNDSEVLLVPGSNSNGDYGNCDDSEYCSCVWLLLIVMEMMAIALVWYEQ